MVPDEADADRAIETDKDKYSNSNSNADPETKLAILKALIACNPSLMANDYKYGAIINQSVEVLKNEPARFHHIYVYSSDDLPLQLTIYNNHVHINFPYLRNGQESVRLLAEIKKYVIIIRKTAGYFVSDPQLGQVYDPETNIPDFFKAYEKTAELVEQYTSKNNYTIPVRKKWWKFW
jgi:hypothetical protein